MTDRRKLALALWAPTATVLVALLGAWQGCTDLRDDVAGLRRDVNAQTRAIERIGERVDATEARSVRNADQIREACRACP